MRRDLRIPPPQSSFLSCEKDVDMILRKIFVESQPYCNDLKRLLVANTKDCLDNRNSEVLRKIDNLTLKDLYENGYIRLAPRLDFPEHEEVKSYIILTMDNFSPTSNYQFRDCTVTFDILCHPDYWDLGGFRMRPIKIAGYIDGILHDSKLTGIGEFQFLGMNELILNQTLAGYTLMYHAVHGSDDKIPH